MGLARGHDPAGSVLVPMVLFKSPSAGPFLASLNSTQIASVPPTLLAPSLYPPLPLAALLLLGTHLACSQATVCPCGPHFPHDLAQTDTLLPCPSLHDCLVSLSATPLVASIGSCVHLPPWNTSSLRADP